MTDCSFIIIKQKATYVNLDFCTPRQIRYRARYYPFSDDKGHSICIPNITNSLWNYGSSCNSSRKGLVLNTFRQIRAEKDETNWIIENLFGIASLDVFDRRCSYIQSNYDQEIEFTGNIEYFRRGITSRGRGVLSYAVWR